MYAATMMRDDKIFSAAAHTFKNIDAFPLSPTLPEANEYEFEDALPLPVMDVQDFRVKKEVFENPFASPFTFPDHEDLESSTSSESDGGFDHFSVEPKIEQQFAPNMVTHYVPHLDNHLPMLEALTEIINGFGKSDLSTNGFSEVQHRYKNFQRLISMLLPILKNPVEEHNLTQAQRNHLKNMLKSVQSDVETHLVTGVLDQRICEWKFHFNLNCPLPRDRVYRENIEASRIYFFKDHAKTYIDPVTGAKRPYALEMNVCVVNEDRVPFNQDVDVKISLFRVFAGGRTEEVPEFKRENGKRKRCWGMIMGDVLKGKSRICVNNEGNDKSKSTAIQTLFNGTGTLYGRVEIPATPGVHRWVLTPANLSDDIGKAIGSDFVVKSKRTARKRKRDEPHRKREAPHGRGDELLL